MISLKYLSRYKDLAWLFIKYGRSDLVKQMGVEMPITEEKTPNDVSELAKDIESLGPTFVKLAQLLSSQLDYLPEPYQDALANLQDNAQTFPYEVVEEIFFSELKVKIKDAFLEFDPKPIAAASLSQVHTAILHSGKKVVVKVQRPGIQEKVMDDMGLLEEMAIFFDNNKLLGNYYWKDRVEALKNILIEELDFRKEANNLNQFSRNLSEFERIIVPKPYEDFTSVKILTMDFIACQKITTLDPVLRIELDGKRLSEDLFKAYLKQIFIDGLVHADPHPGNVYLSEDNKQIVFLDLGMVEHISHQMQQDLLKIFLAISEGRGEEIADLVIKLGRREDDFNAYKFKDQVANVVAQNLTLNWEKISLGKIMLKIARVACDNGLQLPLKFNTLGKTFLNLDGIVSVLAPDFNPNRFMQENISGMFGQRLGKIISEASISQTVLEMYDFVKLLPAKLTDFFETLSKNDVKFKIQAFDEHFMMKGFEKVANRIALGLVLAALILGSVELMKVPTDFHLFGYPGLAIILFLGAVFGGVAFILNIIFHDEKKDKK